MGAYRGGGTESPQLKWGFPPTSQKKQKQNTTLGVWGPPNDMGIPCQHLCKCKKLLVNKTDPKFPGELLELSKAT